MDIRSKLLILLEASLSRQAREDRDTQRAEPFGKRQSQSHPALSSDICRPIGLAPMLMMNSRTGSLL